MVMFYMFHCAGMYNINQIPFHYRWLKCAVRILSLFPYIYRHVDKNNKRLLKFFGKRCKRLLHLLLALPAYYAEQALAFVGLLSVCPSVRLSQNGPKPASTPLQVCCWWPGRQEISIDCCTAHCSAAGECGQCHVVGVYVVFIIHEFLFNEFCSSAFARDCGQTINKSCGWKSVKPGLTLAPPC